MKVSASVENKINHHEVSVETNGLSRNIQIAAKSEGFGSSVNGAELLLLSIATCFCNDIYREARKKQLSIESVKVFATGEFGAEGEPGANFQYRAEVQSDAPAAVINALIREVDQIAEIHKTLRMGIDVKLI